MAYQVGKDSIVQAILRGRMNDQETMNVIHFRPIDPPAGDIADGLANLIEIASIIDINPGGWSNLLSLATSDQFNISWVQLQYVWPTRFSYHRVTATNPAGTLVGDPAPPNVSAAITMQGDGVGRHQRSTMHIGGLRAEDVASGLVGIAVKSALADLAAFLIEPFAVTSSSLNYEMVIYQRSAPGASVPISHFTIQDTSRVERRRTVGLGT